jgi:hypothetical protein
MNAEVAELLSVSKDRRAPRVRNAFTDLAESFADRDDLVG